MSNPLVKTETPSQDEWTMITAQADTMLKSGFLPSSIKTKEQAVAIALKGRELGIPMMQALSGINVIQGKPCISSELMLGLIFRNCPGARIEYLQNNAKGCVIKAARPGGAPSTFSFTIEDAALAGVASKDNWRKFPTAMLRARCISAMARAMFPDAIMGCSYTPEEMGAVVTDEGEIVEMPPEENPKRLPRSASEKAGQIAKEIEHHKANPPPKFEQGTGLDFVVNMGTKFFGKKWGDVSRAERIEFVEWAEGKKPWGERLTDAVEHCVLSLTQDPASDDGIPL